MLINNLKCFSSFRKDGNMNTAPRFYPEGMTAEERRADFNARRIVLGNRLGINGLNILVPSQKAYPVLNGKTEEEKVEILNKYHSKYPDGHYVHITKDMIDGIEDLYNVDIYADILMIDSTLPHIALAYPVADCPVVIAQDNKKKVAAMAHCGGEYVDRDLAGQIIDSLYEELDSRPEDISLYIGPHAQKKSYTYDSFPKFIKNQDRWEDCVIEDKGVLHLDFSKAILMQAAQRGVTLDRNRIVVSSVDTITNPRYYSNNASSSYNHQPDQTKEGRFYTGCFYKTDEEIVKSYRR